MIAASALLFAISVFGQDPPEAEATFAAAQKRMSAAKTASGKVTSSAGGTAVAYDFVFAKPNRYRIEGTDFTACSDGATEWFYMAKVKEYTKRAAGKSVAFTLVGFEGLFGDNIIAKPKAYRSVESNGVKRVEVELNTPDVETTLVIDSATELPTSFRQKRGSMEFVMTYEGVKLDEEFPDSTFVWSPPPGVVERKQPTPSDYTAGMLKVGTIAPDFTLANRLGGKLKLTEVMKGKRGTIVNFWFYG